MDQSKNACSLKILYTTTFKLCIRGIYGINEFCDSIWTLSPRWFTISHIWKDYKSSNNPQIWSTLGPKYLKKKASKSTTSSFFSHNYQWTFKWAPVSTDVWLLVCAQCSFTKVPEEFLCHLSPGFSMLDALISFWRYMFSIPRHKKPVRHALST